MLPSSMKHSLFCYIESHMKICGLLLQVHLQFVAPWSQLEKAEVQMSVAYMSDLSLNFPRVTSPTVMLYSVQVFEVPGNMFAQVIVVALALRAMVVLTVVLVAVAVACE